MTDTDVTVLDHVERIEVPGRVFDKPVNEYWALICLWEGLNFLYRQAAHCDAVANDSLGAPRGTYIDVFGNDPAFDSLSMPLLVSAFHWYAVSACQYVRTVGAIARRFNGSRANPAVYVASVIPEVLAFRNKVAAHFAWTMDHNQDNEAERAFSVMPPLSFIRGSFHVGGMSVYVRRGDDASSSAAIKPWSICGVHSRLRTRYWPEQTDQPPSSLATSS
ncbi:MAG TPA: hypothetical protein VND64_08475 [Pirellulales bacterium]|nr:hypothetical protein [Pirellulales bacterium]